MNSYTEQFNRKKKKKTKQNKKRKQKPNEIFYKKKRKISVLYFNLFLANEQKCESVCGFSHTAAAQIEIAAQLAVFFSIILYSHGHIVQV